jgi:hypothetical protein
MKDLRDVHRRLFLGQRPERKQHIGVVEQEFPAIFGVGAGQLFGVDGHDRHHDLLRAAVWGLHHQLHIALPKRMIAEYLNLPEQEVERYWTEATTIMVEGASNPAHEKMLACFQCFGPAIARLLSTVL